MEFCGRCGHQLARRLDRGRFCARCGHEASGNARYPLYADGTAAVTRPRPASVTQPAATAVSRAVPRTVTVLPDRAPEDVTRPRPRSVSDRPLDGLLDGVLERVPDAASARPASWRYVVAITLATMLVVVLLGLFLLAR